MKEKNQISHYTYVKSSERATTGVNMVARVDIVRREIKSNVQTKKSMDMPLKTVIEKMTMRKNVRSVTRRVTKKKYSGRNKKTLKKNKSI